MFDVLPADGSAVMREVTGGELPRVSAALGALRAAVHALPVTVFGAATSEAEKAAVTDSVTEHGGDGPASGESVGSNAVRLLYVPLHFVRNPAHNLTRSPS